MVNVSESKYFWQGISDRAAVLWRLVDLGEDMAGTEGPIGLVMWGNITWDGLQSIGLSRLTDRRAGFPEWWQEEPPDAGEIKTQWELGAPARAEADRHAPPRIGDLLSVDTEPASGRLLLAPRQPGEDPSAFYARIASFYRVTMSYGGKPTTAIAESAGVPKTTAARWVREARQRNFLSPTTKGRSRS